MLWIINLEEITTFHWTWPAWHSILLVPLVTLATPLRLVLSITIPCGELLVKMSFSVDCKAFQILSQPSLRKPCRHFATPPLVSSRNDVRATIACSAGVFFGRAICSRKRHVGNGAYFYSPQSSTVIKSKMAATTITNTNKVSPTQNTPALQARATTAKIRLFSSGRSFG